MPDYNLGTAHGTVEVDYDGKGVKQARTDADNLGKTYEETGRRVKSAADLMEDEQRQLAAAVRQLQMEVSRAAAQEAAAQARVAAAEENLNQIRGESAASIQRLHAAQKQLIDSQNRAVAAADRLKVSQSALANAQDRLSRIRPKVDIDVDRSKFDDIINRLRNIDANTKKSAFGLNAFSGRLRAIAALAALASPSIAGLGVSLAALAGVAGVAAGALAGLLAVAGTLATAFSGIGEVFKEAGKQQKGAGQSAQQLADQQRAAARQIEQAIRSVRNAYEQLDRAREDAAITAQQVARQVIAAERGLRDAQTDAIRAQRDLNRARQDAVRQLEDMRSALTGGALDERQAIIDVQRAQEDLQKTLADPTASDLDRQQAILNLEKQQHALEETRKQNQRLAQDSEAAAQAGVEGSDRVVDANENVRDSMEALGDAQLVLREAVREGARQQLDAFRAVRDASEQVIEAQKDLEDAYANAASVASSAGAGMADAMARISPEARELVSAILDQSKAWEQVKFAVQDALFAGLAEEVAPLANDWLPLIRKGLVGIAEALNIVIKDFIEFFKTADAQNDVAEIFENTRRAVEELGPALRNILEIFLDLSVVGSRFLPELAAKVSNLTQRWKENAQASRDSGGMEDWIRGGIEATRDLIALLGNLGSIVATIFLAFDQEGGSALQILVDMTQRLEDFLNSAEGQTILKELGMVLAELARVITDVLLAAIKALAPAFVTLGPLFRDFVTIVGKELVAAFELLEPLLTAFAKVIEFLGPGIVPVVASMYALNKAVGAATKAWAAFNTVLKGNPFILIASLVIALVFLIIDNWDSIRPKLEAIWLWIQFKAEEIWNKINSAIIEPVKNAVQTVQDFFSVLRDFVVSKWNQLKHDVGLIIDTFVGNFTRTISDGVQKARDFFSNLPGNILNALGNLGNTLVNAGMDLIRGLIDGIGRMIGRLWDKVESIADTISNVFSAALSIFSPSKVFAEFGRFTMEGYIVGLDDMESKVIGRVLEISAQIKDAGEPEQPTITPGDFPPGFFGGAGTAMTTGAPPAEIHIGTLELHVAGNLDPTNPVQFRKTMTRIRDEIRKVENQERK